MTAITHESIMIDGHMVEIMSLLAESLKLGLGVKNLNLR